MSLARDQSLGRPNRRLAIAHVVAVPNAQSELKAGDDIAQRGAALVSPSVAPARPAASAEAVCAEHVHLADPC